MIYFFNKIKNRILWEFHKIFPTNTQKELLRWYKDGGDYNLCFNYPLNSSSVVFDVGGFDGQFASDLFSRNPCNIYVFEPVKIYYDQLKKRFRNNKKIKVFDFGLSGRTRKEEIALLGPGSSIFRGINKGIKSEMSSINLKDIDEFINEKSIDQIDLLKLNIEGGEYELLPRLIENGLLSIIKRIQIQFHEISDNSQNEREAIREQLSKTHECEYNYVFIWENWVRKDLIK